MSKADLRIDWASHKAAKYACEHWHYSKCMPVGKLVKVGVWEKGIYKGCVIFSRGANKHMAVKYGLTQDRCVELSRVALREHCVPVSRILAIAIKWLKRSNPDLQLIVSYADTMQGHDGVIYQAGNWIYDGITSLDSLEVNGKVIHRKSLYSKYGHSSAERLREQGFGVKKLTGTGKYRYVMPLNADMRENVRELSKPYPKRMKQAMLSNQLSSGGATPTHTLQLEAV